MKKLLIIIIFAAVSLQSYSQYTIVSGGTISTCSGTLTLGAYTPGQLYTITICSNSSTNFQIALINISLNLAGGTLCAYDGSSTAAPLIGCSFPGTAITSGPGNISGCMTLTFQSSAAGATISAGIQCNFICQPFQVDVATNPVFTTINGINYVDICQNELVTFTATGIYPGTMYAQSDATTTFNWDYAYGITQSGVGLTTTSHTFVNQVGYDISVGGVDTYNCTSTNATNLRVRVSQTPSFAGVSAIPSTVCTGQPITLDASSTINDTLIWTNLPNNQYAGMTYLPDGSGVSYNTSVTSSGFNPGATITSINDLVGICVNMEHSFLGDLTMYITCPNGTTVQLENQGGGGTYLGVPIDLDTPVPGVGWDYCWSPNPQYGIMSVEGNNYTTLPSGSYTSFQPLTNLIGCPLNGQWTFTVTDNWSIDNGYIFNWGVQFDPSLYPNVWSYDNWITNYNWSAPAATGNYTISNGTNGTGTVTFSSTGSPGVVTQEPILLTVTDNFGCVYDTTIIVNVLETEPLVINNLAAGYCVSDPAVTLSGYPANGNFSGPGIVAPSDFNPAIAGIGNHTITYDYYYVASTTQTGVLDIFVDDFSTNLGWTGYGAGGWARASAVASTTCSGGQDPAQDHTATADNFIIGTYIGDCYPNSMTQTYWLTSPVINCSNMNSCVLDFWSQSGCESSSFDHMYIDVYDGTAWQNVYTNASSTAETIWTLRTYNVAQATNNANFRIRFGLGSTDGSVTYQGWNIDDLTLTCNGSISVIDTLCDFTTTQDVMVSPQPSSDFSVVSPICVYNTSTITYTGNAPAGSTYNWDFNGGTIISGTGAGPYEIQWATPAIYTVSLTVTSNGCTSTATILTVDVLPYSDPFCCQLPAPNAGVDANVCSNIYTLQATPSLPGGLWTCIQTGANIISPANPTSPVQVTNYGVYNFVFTEIFGPGCENSDTITITFIQQPIAEAGPTFNICSHTATLNATPSVGTGTWTCNNPQVTFANANLSNSSVTVPSDGLYTFVWTEDNGNNCISFDNISANFAEQPVANAGADNAVCLLSYNLQAVPSAGTGTWTVSGAGSAYFQNLHSPITSVDVNLTGIYNFIWTEDNGLGCIDRDTVQIQLTQIPTSTFTATTIPCFGDYSTLTYFGNGSPQCTYTWNFAAGNAYPGIGPGPHTISWATDASYTVTLQVSLNGCNSPTSSQQIIVPPELQATIQGIDLPCFGIPSGEVHLTVTGGTPISGGNYYYVWNNGYLSEDLTNMNHGFYAVTVTDANGCSLSRSTYIYQPPQLSLIVTPSQTICPGDDATLTIYPVGGTFPYQYYWNGAVSASAITVNPSQTTTYSAYVKDANNCQSHTASTTVAIHPPLQLTAFTNIDSICPAESIIIYFTASEGSGAPYVVTGSDGNIIHSPYTYYPPSSTSFVVTATDDCNQTDIVELPIFVYQQPPNAFLADTINGCQPFNVQFNEISPNMGQTYIWDFGDNTNLSLAKNPKHTFHNYGIFDITLTVTSVDGCKTVNVIDSLITVYPKPTALYTYDPAVVSILKPMVSFYNISQWGYEYIWSFGTDDSSSMTNPTYIFPGMGTYNVSLIAITEYGCRDTAYSSVLVRDEVTFYAPNAFSPDNDGTNDIFFVSGHGIDPKTFKMFIYNRWGQVVWETDKWDENNPQAYGWNGKNKPGNTIKGGTYTWICFFNDFRGGLYEKAGTVTVIW